MQCCLSLGYDTMSQKERARVRNLFSDANRQMHESRRARIELIAQAQAMRRSRITQEARRLMAESRNLQEMADMEGIPLSLPLQPSPLRRQVVSKAESSANLVKEIANLMGDIEKAEKKHKSD